MNLLEVQNVSKTYGEGEIARTRIEKCQFFRTKGRICRSCRGFRFGEKYTSEYDRCA